MGPKKSGVRVLRRFTTGDSGGGQNDSFIQVLAKWRCDIYAKSGPMTREEQGIWNQTTHRAIGRLTGLNPELQPDDRLEKTSYMHGQPIVELFEVRFVDFPRRTNRPHRNPEGIQADLVIIQPADAVVAAS
jgi:hypothetical protein